MSDTVDGAFERDAGPERRDVHVADVSWGVREDEEGEDKGVSRGDNGAVVKPQCAADAGFAEPTDGLSLQPILGDKRDEDEEAFWFPPEHPDEPGDQASESADGGAEQRSDVAAEQVKAFVGGTLQAFAQGGLRLAAHAVGLGVPYEAYYWAAKGMHAIEALASDDGMEVDLPVPVDGLDLMVRISTVGGGAGEVECPVTAFIAPGEGSLVGAVDIGPADGHDDRDHEPAAEHTTETIPDRGETTENPETRTANLRVTVYDQVAVAEIDLAALRHRTRRERVAVLRERVEQELRPRFIGRPETHDLALVIGYDPVLGLLCWVRIDPDLSRTWRMIAEFDPATERLVVIPPKMT
jgi:hypothetical protein